MKTRRSNGFTLVELMVVAVIVAILSAIAIPVMTVNKKKAMVSEAEAGLGSVRGALRAMFAETRDYSRDPNGENLEPGPVFVVPGVGFADLEGTYFRANDYEIETIGSASFLLRCIGSTGPVQGVTVTLDHRGTFNRSGL